MNKFQKNILENLKKNGINSLEELNEFRYAGGDSKSHFNYFKLLFKDEELPSHSDKCICNTDITENCYIVRENDNEFELLVLGSCCIKKFVSKCKRTCNVCGMNHKNRKLNLCNSCKRGICLKCENKFDSDNDKRSYCYDCVPSYW